MKIMKEQFIEKNPWKNIRKITKNCNSLVWHFIHLYIAEQKPPTVPLYIATIMFNEKFNVILNIYNTLSLIIEPETKNVAFKKQFRNFPMRSDNIKINNTKLIH